MTTKTRACTWGFTSGHARVLGTAQIHDNDNATFGQEAKPLPTRITGQNLKLWAYRWDMATGDIQRERIANAYQRAYRSFKPENDDEWAWAAELSIVVDGYVTLRD